MKQNALIHNPESLGKEMRMLSQLGLEQSDINYLVHLKNKIKRSKKFR